MFLGWNLPNHYPPYPSYHTELIAAIGLVMLTVGLRLAPRPAHLAGTRPWRLPLPISALAMSSLACVPLLQWISGQLPFRADALLGLEYGVGGAIAIYAGHLWAVRVGTDRVLRLLFGTILAGAIAALGFGLAQWAGLPPSGWWAMERIGDRPFGNLAQSNHFGLLMVVGALSAIALFEVRSIRSPAVLAVVVGYLGWGILISQSRAAALAFVLTICVWSCTRFRTPTRLRPKPVLLATAIWLVLFTQLEHIQNLILLNDQSVRARLDGGVRPAMWHHFWTAVQAHPWLGYGFNQGVAAMAEVATQLPPSATRSTTYAHNFVLDLAVWGGLPLALAATTALVFWTTTWLKPTADERLRQWRHLVFAVWLVLGVQSLLEYPYAYAYFLLPLLLLAGAIESPRRVEPKAWALPSRSATVLVLIAAGVLSAVVWDYTHLEEDYRQARFARYNYQNRPHHDFYNEPLALDLLSSMNRAALRPLRPGMSPEEINEMRNVARRIQSPAVQIDYAKTLALNGRLDEAWHELAILRSLYAPEVYAAIENEWKNWMGDNASLLPKS